MSQTETRLLPRERITNALEEAVRRFPLVVLTAPMGYGKTTAAREFLRDLDYRQFYVTIDPGEHNAFYLWDRACGQLTSQGSGFGDSMRRMGFPQDAVQAQRTFSQGKEYLGGRDTLVVIDDYHNVKAPEVDLYLEAMARERIPGMHVLLISRTRPNMPLEEMRLKGLAMFFGKDFLTFSEKDAIQYFALNGIQDEKTAGTAWNYAEGWAAALWISLHSYQANGILSPVDDMEKLLFSTLFSRYDEAEQSLLLQLSILSSFTPRQAAQIAGDSQAPRRLRGLLEKNALMTYDATTDRYRFHSIFHSFLTRMFDEESTPAAKGLDHPGLYLRAGEWSVDEGDMLQALRYFFKAGTDEGYLRILQQFERPGDGLLIMFDPEGVSGMIQAIPWSVRSRCPIGYLSYIYHYLSRVDRAKGKELLREAQKRFMDDPNLSPERKKHIQGECELIKGIDTFNDLYAMRDQHETAYRLLEGGRSHISHRKLIWTFGCPHVSFLYLRDPDGYSSLVDLVEGNLFYYQEMADGCSFGAQDLFRAEYLLETGALKKVEPYLMKSVYLATSKEQAATLIANYFTQARLKMALGQQDDLSAPLLDLQPVIRKIGNPLLANSIDLSLGYIAAIQGRVEDIPAWLKDARLAISRGFWQGLIFSQITHGKALLALGEWPLLEALSQTILSHLRLGKNVFGNLHANILLSIAVMHQHGLEAARPYMATAIEIARPSNIVLSIAEYAPYVQPLLEDMQSGRRDDAFLTAISRMGERYIRKAPAATPWGLTQRQREMIELAISGESNQAIAKALDVKPVTVGNTLTRIYKKLGVQNRMEAAKVWRRFIMS